MWCCCCFCCFEKLLYFASLLLNVCANRLYCFCCYDFFWFFFGFSVHLEFKWVSVFFYFCLITAFEFLVCSQFPHWGPWGNLCFLVALLSWFIVSQIFFIFFFLGLFLSSFFCKGKIIFRINIFSKIIIIIFSKFFIVEGVSACRPGLFFVARPNDLLIFPFLNEFGFFLYFLFLVFILLLQINIVA